MHLIIAVLLNFNGQWYELDSFTQYVGAQTIVIEATHELIFNNGFEDE